MPKMPQADLLVALPKGSKHTNSGERIAFKHGDHNTQLAMDIADALRELGYSCDVYITRETLEKY